MLERKAYSELLKWKNRDHKCLVVTGQRQVGKSYIIDLFGKTEYERYIYINFATMPEKKRIFEENITDESLIQRLVLEFGSDSISEGSTLLFLDEIQECANAYASLKPFTAYGKIDVICSGSLLGVTLPQDNSVLIPLGYEERLRMYALDFEEFLWANGIPKDIIQTVRDRIRERKAIDDAVFRRFSELFRIFMIVGGMPEAVDAYIETKDFRPAEAAISVIREICTKDINRYNSNREAAKTRECFESIPNQLAESNKKFMYSRIGGEGTRMSSQRYMENLLWIKDAGYGNFCYALSQPTLALSKQIKKDNFKVYLSDTGMLLDAYGDKAKAAVYKGDNSYNMGAATENAVAEALMKNGITPTFYRKDKGDGRMEINFVLEFRDGIAAIEVRSGKKRSFRSIDKIKDYFQVSRRIMFETGNIFTDEDGIEHYPLFASAFIKEMDPKPEDMKFSYD